MIISKFRVFLLCIVTALTLASCGSDDDDNGTTTGGAFALPASALGDYSGTLFDGEDPVIIGGSAISTATITETGSNTYTVSFANNTSIEGLVFTATTSTIFTSNNTDNAVVITLDINGEDVIAITTANNTETVFGGTK